MQKKVIGAKETVKLNIQGNLVTMSVYVYTLDDFGPFTFEIEKAQDSAEALLAEMKRKEAILEKSLAGE